MATSDSHNVSDTSKLISTIGTQKSKQRIDHIIIKSILAGMLLSFGGLFLLTVGGGSAPLAKNLGPGLHRMIQASVFPIGLMLIVITGAEIFTGNIMFLLISTLNRKTSWVHLIISWTVSYFGNLAGCIFFHTVLVYYAGLLSNEPYRSFAILFAETKGNIKWHEMFLRGIGGNWLVCLAIWFSTSARELHSKLIGIYFPIWLFVAVGYEHSIANMFTVQMGMMLGANLSIGKYILSVMIPVTLGNIVGGGFFVGFLYWYLYLLKTTDTNTENKNKLSINNDYQVVKQQEENNQHQQA